MSCFSDNLLDKLHFMRARIIATAMSGYRDSYFQYHHLLESHQVLYNEWNQDEFPPPDEQKVGHTYNGGAHDEGNGSNRHDESGDPTIKTGKASNSNTNVYWDYFHDEEDWNLFKNVQLESNGMATFNPPTERQGHSEEGKTTQGGEASNSIIGSIFNHVITKTAMRYNNNWNDLSIPRP